MKSNKTLSYMIWADNSILSLVSDIDETQLSEDDLGKTQSIKDKLLHLTEEYRAWLCDIQKINFKEYIDKYQTMSNSSLIQEINVLHGEWLEYLDNHGGEITYDIDEGEFSVSINLDEVIYNLVNHSTYHRGQIVLLLRMMNIEVPITDYYWYKINNLKNR